MVKTQYVFTCDECGKEEKGEGLCSIIWGIDPCRPVLPSGWTLLSEFNGCGGKTICDQHRIEIQPLAAVEMPAHVQDAIRYATEIVST